MSRQQVPNYELARDTARSNLLTNGGFEIWQRGNGPFTATGVFTTDRWAIFLPGGTTMTVQRQAYADAGQYAARIDSTGSGAQFFQTLKTSEHGLLGRTVTFSISVQSTIAVTAVLQCDGTGGGVFSGTPHTGDNTWRRLTVTAAVPGNATYVQCCLNFPAAATTYTDGAMLVLGSVAADYAPLHPADDLARCLRYYERSIEAYMCTGYMMSTTRAEYVLPYYAVKPVTPTITTGAASNFAVRIGGSEVTASAVSFVSGMTRGTLIQIDVASAQTVNAGTTLRSLNANGFIAIEANP